MKAKTGLLREAASKNCMLVDEARRPGKSNALTQIAIELTDTDNRYGNPGHVAGGDETMQGGVVNARDSETSKHLR
jgi:hypothetical protein